MTSGAPGTRSGRRRLAVLASAAALTMAAPMAAVAAPGGSPGERSTVKNFQHVFVIVMENRGYDAIIGNRSAPWTNSAADSYGLARNYYGVTHPSQPNYIALTSGAAGGDLPLTNADRNIPVPNLVDQLESHGKTWRAYNESYDYAQSTASAGSDPRLVSADPDQLYERKHNPFVSYTDIQGSPRMNNVVDLKSLDGDLASGKVPDFVWITPNQCSDMHGVDRTKATGDPTLIPQGCDPTHDRSPNGTPVGSDGPIAIGDKFLGTTVDKITSSPAWTGNSLIAVVWDESDVDPLTDVRGCCNDSPRQVPPTGPVTAGGGGGHVVALTISHNQTAPRVSDTAYDHYSLLRTIEDGWGLGTLGRAADRSAMADLVGPTH